MTSILGTDPVLDKERSRVPTQSADLGTTTPDEIHYAGVAPPAVVLTQVAGRVRDATISVFRQALS